MWNEEFKKEFEIWLKPLKVLQIIQYCDEPLSTHYHFKTRWEMRLAMQCNSNPWDTFSYAGKDWKQIVITKEWLIENVMKWRK